MASHRRGRPPHEDVLTPAEWRVAHAVRHGMSTRVIAARHGVSQDAVKFHVANILRKLDLGSRRELRSWMGVPQDSLLSGSPKGSPMDLQLGSIGQISRRVSDIEQATAWYRDVLGLPFLYAFGDLAFFDCAGTRLFLSALDEGGQPDGESILYFRVGDIHAAQRELEGRGVVFDGAPHMIHKHADTGVEEWMTFFADSDGHALALMAQVAPVADSGA